MFVLRLLNGPTITVRVGKEKFPFTVSMNLLIHHSPAIRNVLNDPSDSDPIIIPNHDPGTFLHVLSWMYTGKFDALGRSTNNLSHEDLRKAATQTEHVLRLAYLLEMSELAFLAANRSVQVGLCTKDMRYKDMVPVKTLQLEFGTRSAPTVKKLQLNPTIHSAPTRRDCKSVGYTELLMLPLMVLICLGLLGMIIEYLRPGCEMVC